MAKRNRNDDQKEPLSLEEMDQEQERAEKNEKEAAGDEHPESAYAALQANGQANDKASPQAENQEPPKEPVAEAPREEPTQADETTVERDEPRQELQPDTQPAAPQPVETTEGDPRASDDDEEEYYDVLIDTTGDKTIDPPKVEETIVREEEQVEQAQLIPAIRGTMTLKDIENRIDMTAKTALYGIEDYVRIMTETGGHIRAYMENKRYVEHLGPSMQVGFYNNIMNIINKTDDNSFKLAMNYLMCLFQEHGHSGKALAAERVMMFMENMRISHVDVKCYHNLMTLFTTCCDPRTRRKEMRNMDMGKIVEYGLSTMAQNRLINYFNS
nr:MAG TPA: MARCKS family [Caudoviricetes sp.]